MLHTTCVAMVTWALSRASPCNTAECGIQGSCSQAHAAFAVPSCHWQDLIKLVGLMDSLHIPMPMQR